MDDFIRFDVIDYLTQNVYDFKDRFQAALGEVDRFRCPLSRADPGLYDEMCYCIEGYCEERGLDPLLIDPDEI